MTHAEPCRSACITTKPLEHCGLQLEERSLPSPSLPSLAVANLTETEPQFKQTKGQSGFASGSDLKNPQPTPGIPRCCEDCKELSRGEVIRLCSSTVVMPIMAFWGDRCKMQKRSTCQMALLKGTLKISAFHNTLSIGNFPISASSLLPSHSTSTRR